MAIKCECGAIVAKSGHADWCKCSPYYKATPKPIECNCKAPDYGHVGSDHALWCLTNSP